MTEDFLQLRDRTILVMGVANRKSIALHVGKVLEKAGADVLYSIRSEARRPSVQKLVGERPLYCCDVEDQTQISRLRDEIARDRPCLHGLLHAIAFADYEGGMRPFHQTTREQFLRAVDVSCYSLIALSEAFRPQFDPRASVVTVSISTTRMASPNYGFMAPVKAALDSSLAFLARSFSEFSEVRFNAVAPSLLKTSASAGIPGYADAYLYAERVIPRRRAVETSEVANAAAFLLSPRSSGINAQCLVIDAGMSINYFDPRLIQQVVGGQAGGPNASVPPPDRPA